MYNKRLTTTRQSIILYLLLACNNVLESTRHSFGQKARANVSSGAGGGCKRKCIFQCADDAHATRGRCTMKAGSSTNTYICHIHTRISRLNKKRIDICPIPAARVRLISSLLYEKQDFSRCS